jgi:hypothetical protein
MVKIVLNKIQPRVASGAYLLQIENGEKIVNKVMKISVKIFSPKVVLKALREL